LVQIEAKSWETVLSVTGKLTNLTFVVSTAPLLLCWYRNPAFGGAMLHSLPFPDELLVTVVLATLAIGLPIVFVLSIRFLLDRNLNLGRSKELEKLIWQLHRIASAMEQQMKQPAIQPPTTTQNVTAITADAVPATPAAHSVRVEQPETPPVATQPASAYQTAPRETSTQGERHGVNSMFGL
jgi:hypothetical protein